MNTITFTNPAGNTFEIHYCHNATYLKLSSEFYNHMYNEFMKKFIQDLTEDELRQFRRFKDISIEFENSEMYDEFLEYYYNIKFIYNNRIYYDLDDLCNRNDNLNEDDIITYVVSNC
jgi:hypothetical protein